MKNQFKVEWNQANCSRPHECGKCLKVCPAAVFALYAPNREEGIAPDEYIISPAMQYFCNGCEECLNVCPNSAIKLIPKSSIQSS